MIKPSLNRLLKYLFTALFLTALTTSGTAGQITKDIQGKLVKKGSGGNLESYKIETEPPLYLFVFSASWCPACNQQMPGLISKYKTLKKKSPNGFEFILVSADRTAEDMKNYMIGKEMPWPGLAFDQRGAAAAAKAFSGKGIPSIVLMTKDGQFINSSYRNKGSGEYQGLPPVLASLEKLLGSDGGSEGKISKEAVEGAADEAAKKLGISGTRFIVATILALGTFLFLFFKN